MSEFETAFQEYPAVFVIMVMFLVVVIAAIFYIWIIPSLIRALLKLRHHPTDTRNSNNKSNKNNFKRRNKRFFLK